MASAGGLGPTGHALSDVTARMAVFGQLFSDDLGGIDVSAVPDAELLLDLVRARMPRSSQPLDEAPVFEAAAFIGEWLRAQVPAAWVADGPHEPHLQASDPSGSIVYLVPLVSMLRLASTAGYDGIGELLDAIRDDLGKPPRRSPLRDLRVRPASDAPLVVAWVQRHRHLERGSSATLWRRCQMCSTLVDETVTNLHPPPDWETDAAMAAGMLAERPFGCSCGGPLGEVSRFLMVRRLDGATRVADIYVAGTHTRIACWTLHGDDVEPYDAGQLAVPMA